MLVVTPVDREDGAYSAGGDYTRLCTTCAVQSVVDSGMDVPEGLGLRDALPHAAGLLVLAGDGREEDPALWASIETPCMQCGRQEGDR